MAHMICVLCGTIATLRILDRATGGDRYNFTTCEPCSCHYSAEGQFGGPGDFTHQPLAS